MQAERWRAAKRLFQEAIEQDEADLGAWLDRACGEDVALRAEVASLLAAHAAAGDRFDKPPLAGAIVSSAAAADGSAPRARVSAYRLLRQLAVAAWGPSASRRVKLTSWCRRWRSR